MLSQQIFTVEKITKTLGIPLHAFGECFKQNITQRTFTGFDSSFQTASGYVLFHLSVTLRPGLWMFFKPSWGFVVIIHNLQTFMTYFDVKQNLKSRLHQ